MSRNHHLTASIILLGLVLAITFTSCCDDDNNNEPTPPTPVPTQPDYTVMLYGCGGGNLDDSFVNNLKQAIFHGKTDKVDMVFQFRLSKHYTDSLDVGTMKGTFRYELGAARDTTNLNIFQLATTRVGNEQMPLHKSETLTDFISWTREKHPARNYVLVLWDHGNGWEYERDTITTRAMIYDDHTGTFLNQNALVQGIKDSGIKLRILYTDLCLMGQLECLCDYADVAEYHIGSCSPTPSLGCNYAFLLQALNEAGTTNQGIETSIDSFAVRLSRFWLENSWRDPTYQRGEEGCDMGWVRLADLPSATEVIQRITDRLCNIYKYHRDEVNLATSSCLNYFRGFPIYDSADYFEQLAQNTQDSVLQALAVEYRTALGQVQHRITPHLKWETRTYDISLGICIYSKNDYENKILPRHNYEALRFDQLSHWSNWLKINERTPQGNPTRFPDDV